MQRARLGRLGLLAVCLSFPRPLQASDPGPLLTWPQAVAAIDQHPALAEARARAEGARGAVAAARTVPNPVFTVAAGAAEEPPGAGPRRAWEYGVELRLEPLGALVQRGRAASSLAEGAREDARSVRAELVGELRRLFMAVAHDQAMLDARRELEREVAQFAALVRRRAERGDGRPTEIPRVEVELEKLRAGVVRASAAAEAKRRRLSTWLGAPVARVEGDLGATIVLPPLPELLARIAEESPVVGAGRARVTAAEREASAERWERLPKLSVGAARAEEADRRVTTLSASLSLPIWDWNSGKVRLADAAAAAERARLDGTRRELAARVADAWLGCSAGQQAAARFRAEILPRAEASSRSLARAWELGEASLLEVIDARRTLLETRTEHLDLLLDMQAACGELAVLAGMELP